MMQQSATPPIPLGSLPLGARARIIAIAGGGGLNRKLRGLGLHLGSELRVEHHRGRGLVVSVGASRVALGGGIVERVLVQPLPAAHPPDAA